MVGREYKRIKRILGMKLCGEEASLVSTNCLLQTTPEVLMERFANDFKFSDKAKEKARKLLRNYGSECSGMKPSIIAGTMLLIAGIFVGEKRTQREIADMIDATEVSVRNGLYRILGNHPDLAEQFKEKSSKQKWHKNKPLVAQEDAITFLPDTETKGL
jgi:transcription initiation factor TFIIIB Brf1 subunit/transcription initiation factor TFIIB